MELTLVRQSFNRGYCLSIVHHRQSHTGKRTPTIYMDGTGSTLASVA
jgi:hypothetical protein